MNDESSLALRQSLGRFATGVTVVTCQGSRGPCGITANSFSSVSLEPPLILWNIARISNSLQAFLCAEHFVINVLGAGQQAIAEHFARTDHTRFDGIDYSLSDAGVPVLADTLARFDCRTERIHEAGDHHIIIGRVDDFRHVGGEPLLFFAGGYGLPD